jgi:hypothetical protein
VPATNDPPTLERCVAAIRAAEEPPEELVVVDRATAPGPAAARNDGAAYARAKRQVAETQPVRRQLAQAAGLRSCSLPTVSLGK